MNDHSGKQFEEMINAKSRFSLLLILLLNIFKFVQSIDLDLLRFEDEVTPEKLWNTSNLKMGRISRGGYAFDGSVELLQTLDENSEFSFKTFFSPNGVDYKLLPFRLAPKTTCEFLNAEYKKYVPNLSKRSDFPEIKDGEYFCPLIKNIYHIRKFEWDTEKLPSTFRAGFYKIQLYSRAASGDEAKVNFYVKVYGF